MDSNSKTRSIQGAKSFVKGLATVIAAAVLALFLLSQFGRYFFIAELLGNFRVQMILLTLFSACVCWVIHRNYLCFLLATATIWNLVLFSAIYLPADQPPPGDQRLKVMSYNVFASANDHQKVLDRIAEENPDVVAIVEFDHHWHQGLKPLQETYAYHILGPRWNGYGIGIFSKYPIDNSKFHQLIEETTDTPMLVTDITIANQIVRVASVHVLSPKNLARLDKRNQQFQAIAQILNSDKNTPTIVLGDFNSVSWSPFMQDFIRDTNYRDTRQGFGYHATWHKTYWPLLIPIDNAYVSRSIHVHDRYVGAGSDSDHYPIVLDISISK